MWWHVDAMPAQEAGFHSIRSCFTLLLHRRRLQRDALLAAADSPQVLHRRPRRRRLQHSTRV